MGEVAPRESLRTYCGKPFQVGPSSYLSELSRLIVQ